VGSISTGRRSLRHGSPKPQQDGKIPAQAEQGPPDHNFRVRVDGLEPGTTYYYTIDFHAYQWNQATG